MREKILLAEGDGAVRRMVARVLELAGYSVTLASTAAEAVSFFYTERPDLLLLNLELAEPGSGELLEQNRPLGLAIRTPVLAIAAGAWQHEAAVQRGIDALMEKPLDLPLLLQTIESLLAPRRQPLPQRQG